MRRIAGMLCVLGLVGSGCSGSSDSDDAGRAADDVVEADAPRSTDATDATDAAVDDVDVVTGDVSDGWTVLVYSIADTDLEPFLLDDVTEMGEVGSDNGLNIVGLVDRASDYSSDPVLGLDDWEGGKLLHVQQGSAEVLAELGDVNTGDPQVLADFIAAGVSAFPATNYALIISDHGASWPGVGGDESAGHDGLDLAELDAGISAGLDAAGLDRFDLLGFDACLMATYEVASTLAPVASRLVASQELEPGHGWDYRVLQLLEDEPATDVDTLGRALVDGFEAQAVEQGTDTEITLSLLDLEQMGIVDEAMSAFTDALTARAAALGPVIGRTRSSTLGFGRNPDPANDTQMVDLGLLVSEIGVEALDVSDQADGVIRALNDAVLHTVSGSATRGATGLSIYFPPEQQWFASEYTGVPAAAGWTGFLEAYYAGGAAIPEEEQPQFTTDEAEVFFDEDGLNIAGVFDLAAQDNLSVAVIEYGIVDDDGTVSFIGREPATVSDDGSGLVLGIYDLTALTISDGVDTAYAYLDLTFDEEAGLVTIDVPMAYYPPGDSAEAFDDVLLTLVLDENGEVLSETYYSYDDELGTYGELTADPEGIIVPQIFAWAADGSGEWVPTSDVGLYADLPALAYDLEALPSGTLLYVELTVYDFGGNSDTVSATVEVP
jgi:Clostripain family